MGVGTAEDAAVRAALAADWDLPDAVIEPHHGGMNSAASTRPAR
jgi:hypothetical protein